MEIIDTTMRSVSTPPASSFSLFSLGAPPVEEHPATASVAAKASPVPAILQALTLKFMLA
ncbi:hypothetical protein AZH47_06475 [Corynebacterium striatum]|nr:hypothetical protein AZH47_06475 [Corynebacterium striatum]